MVQAVRQGLLAPGLPYVALGQGSPLMVLEGFGPERTRPAGLAHRRRVWLIKPYAEHFSCYVVSWCPERPPPGTTMADVAGAFAHGIHATFGEPVPVVGTSTGGSIAQQLAADHPDIVARLVLVTTAYRLDAVGRAAQRCALESAGQGRDRQAWLALSQAIIGPRVSQWALGMLSWLTSAGFTPGMLALLAAEDAFDLGRRLSEITAPTLVVGGDRDRCYDRELVEATAQGIPRARLVLYEGRGHIGVSMDKRLRRDVLTFLLENGTHHA
jgi:pimeloyl-ACP methyl ester carboxylesterase